MSTFVKNTVASGAVIYAADHNELGNRVATALNGGIENDNIATGAAIATSKLADDAGITAAKIGVDAVTATKIDWASTGADGGIWWEELGRATLSSAGDTVSVASLPARKYLRVLVSLSATGGTINAGFRFNNDSSTNYASRSSGNGAADGTGGSLSIAGIAFSVSANDKFVTANIVNVATKEKLFYAIAIERGTAGAANAPDRIEAIGKWANTTDQITRIDVVNATGTGDFAIGSEVVVLGHN